MKKITLTTLVFFTFLIFTKAQIQKGTYTMRPSLYISQFDGRVLGTSANNRPLKVDIGMHYGKFVTNQLLIRGGINTDISNQARNYPSYAAELFAQYYYLKNSKLKPYVIGGFDFSRDLVLQILSNPTNKNDSIRHINQLDASFGTGIQYFINENIALDARIDFTALAITDKDTRQLYEQSYSLSLRPFYTSATYQSAKEINDFFYKGKTQISGQISYNPKTINAIGGSSFFQMNFGAKYSLNKWLAVGGNFYHWNSSNANYGSTVGFSANTEANVKLSKRLYLTPNVGVFIDKNEIAKSKTTINANLGSKYFINKNIAWTADFLSFQLYESRKSIFQPQSVFFNTGIAYYLK